MDGSPGDTYCETCWASFLEQNKQLEGVWQEDGTPYDLAEVDPFAADCNATHGKGVNLHEIVRRAILLPDPFQLLVLFQEAGPACLAIDIPGGSIIRVSCCPAAGASTDIPQREDVQPGVSGPKPPGAQGSMLQVARACHGLHNHRRAGRPPSDAVPGESSHGFML